MAIVGAIDLGLNEVVSEGTNNNNNIEDNTIETSDVEINDEQIGDRPSNSEDKIDKIDVIKVKNRLRKQRKQIGTVEERIKDYEEFLVNEVITEINVDEIVETPTKLVIKLNSNETKLSYDDNFFDIESLFSSFVSALNEKQKDYLRNILNNLNRDYYDKLKSRIDTMYIKFDNEYNDIIIKKFIIHNIVRLTDTFGGFFNRRFRR